MPRLWANPQWLQADHHAAESRCHERHVSCRLCGRAGAGAEMDTPAAAKARALTASHISWNVPWPSTFLAAALLASAGVLRRRAGREGSTGCPGAETAEVLAGGGGGRGGWLFIAGEGLDVGEEGDRKSEGTQDVWRREAPPLPSCQLGTSPTLRRRDVVSKSARHG